MAKQPVHVQANPAQISEHPAPKGGPWGAGRDDVVKICSGQAGGKWPSGIKK